MTGPASTLPRNTVASDLRVEELFFGKQTGVGTVVD
jgi:hypothetical protein